MKTTEDVGGDKIAGQAESARTVRHAPPPDEGGYPRCDPSAIDYANWTYGWITTDELDFYNPPQLHKARG